MDYLYKIKRKVIFGRNRGQKLGYPTANLKYYKRDEVMKSGVYSVIVELEGKKCQGVAHIGKSKTFQGKNDKIEIYLFKYSKTLYGKVLNVNFINKIRGTKKFNNKELLINQIKNDCRIARKYLNIK